MNPELILDTRKCELLRQLGRACTICGHSVRPSPFAIVVDASVECDACWGADATILQVLTECPCGWCRHRADYDGWVFAGVLDGRPTVSAHFIGNGSESGQLSTGTIWLPHAPAELVPPGDRSYLTRIDDSWSTVVHHRGPKPPGTRRQ